MSPRLRQRYLHRYIYLFSPPTHTLNLQDETAEERKARRKAKKEAKAATRGGSGDSPKKKKKKSEA
jgi:hypothetical protein